MAINKVIVNGETKLDLTHDTVAEDTLLAGSIAHSANGSTIIGTVPRFRNAMRRFVYYVDGISGNDNNDGTDDYPFKTLKKALSSFDHGHNDVMIYFKSAGTYNALFDREEGDAQQWVRDFGIAVLHMSGPTPENGDPPSVTVRFGNSGDDAAFYSMHLNCNNINIDINDHSKSLYFDGCAVSLDNVTFGDFLVAFNYSGVKANNCTFWSAKCYATQCRFNNCKFKNNRNRRTIDIDNNSSVTISGTCEISQHFVETPIQDDDKEKNLKGITALIYVNESTLRLPLNGSVTYSGTRNNRTCRGVYYTYSTIYGTKSRIEKFANMRMNVHSSANPKIYALYSVYVLNYVNDDTPGIEHHSRGNNEVITNSSYNQQEDPVTQGG